MTTLAKTSKGIVLKMAVSGGAVAAIAELFSISPPVIERASIDATTHDSAGDAMEFISEGVYDPGEIQIQGHYVAGSAGDDLLVAALTGGGGHDYEIVVKAATGTETLSGACIVTSYGPDGMEVQGKQTFSATLKLSGAITQAATI